MYCKKNETSGYVICIFVETSKSGFTKFYHAEPIDIEMSDYNLYILLKDFLFIDLTLEYFGINLVRKEKLFLP